MTNVTHRKIEEIKLAASYVLFMVLLGAFVAGVGNILHLLIQVTK